MRGWRPVPVDPDALGAAARASAPTIEQAVLEAARGWTRRHRAAPSAPGKPARRPRRPLRRVALVPHGRLQGAVRGRPARCRSIADLRDPRRRDSVRHLPPALLDEHRAVVGAAQPFRLLCHNGEINAIRGNVNWMRARAVTLGRDHVRTGPCSRRTSSDSGMLDNALELLVRGGRDVEHALAMLIPPAWQGDPELETQVRDFHRFHAGLVEPWDGPAGHRLHATAAWSAPALDRNGLRPLRYTVAGDLVCCGSEAGVFDLPDGPVQRGTPRPGRDARPSTPTAASRTTARSSGGSPRARRTAAGSASGGAPGPSASRLRPPEEELAARHVLLRLHARGADGRRAPVRRARARADLVDGRRHRPPAARRPRAAVCRAISASASPR